MHLALIAFSTTLLVAQTPSSPEAVSSEWVTVPCLVTLIDEVEVPAQEAGVLDQILVKEGQQVREGDLLAQIDDKQARALEEVAAYTLEAASAEADNDINVRYATAAAAVAKAEYAQAIQANNEYPGTIAPVELRRLALKVEQFTLQIEQSQHELAIAAITVRVRQAELKAAQEDVARRKINAPLDGMVEKVHSHAGEFVRPGDPVLKLVRMDSLWVEGFLNAIRYTPANVRGQPVTVTVNLPGRQETFQGRIVHASNVVEAGPQFLVKAEVTNRQESDDWVLRSGLNAEMSIKLK